jgi:hypothetical protein
MAMGVMTRIEDLNTVLGQTQDHRHRVLDGSFFLIRKQFGCVCVGSDVNLSNFFLDTY